MNAKTCLFLLCIGIFPALKCSFAQDSSRSLSSLLKLADSLKYNAPDEAMKYARRGLDMAVKASDKKNSALAYSLLGMIKCIQGDFTESLNYHLEAVKINEILDDKPAIGRNYNNIGMALDNAGKDSSALSYYLRSIRIQEDLGEEKDLIKSYNNLGILYNSGLGQGDKAIHYFEKAAKLARKNGLALIEGSIKHNIGLLYISDHNYSKALELLLQSLEAHQKVKNDRGTAANYLYIGKTFLFLNNHGKGLEHIEKALILAKEKGFTDILSECYLQLAGFYEKDKQFALALDNFKLWAKAEEKIINEASVGKMAEMQTKYETEKKEKENALLLKENKIKTLELSQREQQKNILIGSFAFIILLGGISYNHYRLKNKNKILQEKEHRANAVFQAQEEEKIRISKELHDGVGPLLSLIKLNISSLESSPANERIITKTKELASESIKEIRNISHSLMPGLLLRSGLQPALCELAEQVNHENLEVMLDYAVSSRLRPEAEVNIYRIVQEAVNNILKHSGADKAEIRLEQQKEDLVLTIRDNGCGFDTGKISSASGNGLNNILSRTDFLKGKIDISACSPSGTCISIRFPLNQNMHA